LSKYRQAARFFAACSFLALSFSVRAPVLVVQRQVTRPVLVDLAAAAKLFFDLDFAPEDFPCPARI
jgi:hypothetical protein